MLTTTATAIQYNQPSLDENFLDSLVKASEETGEYTTTEVRQSLERELGITL